MGQHEENFDFIGQLSGGEDGNAQADTRPEPRTVEGCEDQGDPKVVVKKDDDEVPVIVHKIPDEFQPITAGGKTRVPTSMKDWRPEWKPRKRIPGRKGVRANQAAIEAVCGKLMVPDTVLASLPRDAEGSIAKSDELFAALRAYVVAGGTVSMFSDATGVPIYALRHWIRTDPIWAEDLEEAKRLGADTLVEKALVAAESPKVMEEVFESYDKEGNLVRKDVRKADAYYARKLLVGTCLDIAKKWAPDKYGDKLEVKTNDTLASRILAARRRSSREGAEDIEVQ